ncbi:MAG: ATP synthase subunit I [Rhodoferax sp.]
MAHVSGPDEDVFTPLTPEQAQALRKQMPALSPWWVVLVQVVVGVVVTVVAWLLTSSVAVVQSSLWGVAAVVLPAALFARGVTGRFARANPGSAVVSFFLWEFAKIVAAVAVMFLAHRLQKDLSWPAMLVGLVLTMKVYWLALGYRPKAAVQRENA